MHLSKTHIILAVTAALSVGQACAQVSPASIPALPPAITKSAPVTPINAQGAAAAADPQLNTQPITVNLTNFSGKLSLLLAALARSAGYDLALDINVDASASAPIPGPSLNTPRPALFNFVQKPFNQLWPLLMDMHGLSYTVIKLGDRDIIRVSSAPIQRVISLQHAPAEDVATRVKLFFGTPQYTETPTRAEDGTPTVARTLSDVKLDSPTLRLVADPRTNTLIVRGTNKEVEEVTRLAGEFDRPDTKPAQAAAPASPVPAPIPVVKEVYGVKSVAQNVTTFLAEQYPTLKVTPFGTTGSIVITGPQDTVQNALDLLGQLDRPGAVNFTEDTVQRTFTLNNASAAVLKDTLETALKRDVGPATAATAVTAVTPTGDTSVTIIADNRTNTLVVQGTPSQVERIATLVPMLDKAVPQITLNIRIQEISETAARNIGIDWTAGFGSFTTKILSGGITAMFDPTKLFTGTNLAATLSALERQGLSKSVYEGTVTMMSGQAKQGQTGGTENASAGAAASIKSGGRLEINIPSAAGNITKQIDYGVLLDFLNPQVSADGTITLGVNSNVSDLKTPIGANAIPNVLEFANREAKTTLTFKDGDTVMLGGLLTSIDRDNKEGLPLLSSIPVIGSLFSKTTKSHEKTQLVIIISGAVRK